MNLEKNSKWNKNIKGKIVVLIIVLLLAPLLLFQNLNKKEDDGYYSPEAKTSMEEIAKQVGELYTTEEIKAINESSQGTTIEQIKKEAENGNSDQDDDKFKTKTLIISAKEKLEIKDAKNVIEYGNIYVAKYDSEELTKENYNKYKEMEQVNFVEVDEVITCEEMEGNTEFLETEEVSTGGTHTEENQSNLGKYIEANSQLGQQILVAILDTGIDLNQQQMLERLVDSKLNYSTSGDEISIMDDNGHGTKVASIILNNTDSATKVMPIKVANKEGKATILSTYFGIMAAIENKVDIINISLATLSAQKSELLESAIKKATEKGILVVVAAGNYGGETKYVTPANIEAAITVTAVTEENKIADFSCYGEEVDFSTYGTNIEATTLGGEIVKESGTSYATAKATSIIAKLKSTQIPNVLETLKTYAIDLGEEGHDKYYGNGLLTLNKVDIEGIEKEEIKTKIEISDFADWKNMTDEELNYYLTNIDEKYLAIFVQSLSKEDLEEIIKKDTILTYDYITYKNNEVSSEDDDTPKEPVQEDKRIPYYQYLLETDFSELEVSKFGSYSSANGYFTLQIQGGGKSNSSIRIKTSISDTSRTTVTQTATFSIVTSSTTNNHGFRLTESTGPTRKFSTKNAADADDTGETGYNNFGDFVYRSDEFGVLLIKASYTKPAYTYATGERITSCYDDCRLNFRKYVWNNINDYTHDDGGVNHSNITANIQMSVHMHSTNQFAGGANGVLRLTLNYPILNVTYNANGGSTSGGSYDINSHVTTFTYGTAKDLYNHSSFGLYRTGYHVVDGQEWGTTASGGTLLDQDKDYQATVFSDFKDGDTVRERNRTVYAQWVINSSTLKVNPNGGTWNGSSSTQSFTQNYNTTKSIPVPTRSGYTFAGWSRSGNNGSLSSTTSNATYRFGATDGATDTLTATWVANSSLQTVYVRYQNSDGSWGSYSTVINSYYDDGEYVSWSRSADAQYKAASIGYYVSGTKTSYVDVERQRYNVTLNRGTGISNVTGGGSYYYGQSCTINATVNTGYTWVNWTGSSTISNRSYTFTVHGNSSYTANARINTSTLSVNPNGGTWEGDTKTQSFTQNYNTTKNIPNPTPPTGYTIQFDGNGGTPSQTNITSSRVFSSWTKSSSFNGTLSGTTYTFGPANGVTDTIVANYVSESILLPNATRTGYNLIGWYTQATGGIKVGDAGSTYTPTEETTLYAQWERKDSSVLVHHYLEQTSNSVYQDVIINGKYGDNYQTEIPKDLDLKYELIEPEPENKTGVMGEEQIVVIYRYRVKDSQGVIVHHIDQETKQAIAPDDILPVNGTGKYGDKYTTQISPQKPANYILVNKTDNWEGTLIDEQIVVTYEYKKEDPITKDENITKTGSNTITQKDEVVNYSINYTAKIDKYIGEATVTIVDKLPYHIDIASSDIAGGKYDETAKTITWEDTITQIDTYTKGEETIQIKKDIKIVYTDIDLTQEKMNNIVTGDISLFTPKHEGTQVTTETKTDLDFKVNRKAVKIWEDNHNKNGKRPENIKFVLKADGETIQTPIIDTNIDTQDRYEYIFENLPKYNEQREEINYTIEEQESTENGLKFYIEKEKITSEEDGIKTTTITNQFHIPDEKIEIPVTIIWQDNKDKFEKRPDSVTITITGNGKTTEQIVTKESTIPEEDNKWVYTFKDMAKYDDKGNEIDYIIGQKDLQNDFYPETNINQENKTIINTFSLINQKVSIPVTKIWDDNNNKAKKRIDAVTLVLTGDGKEYEKELTNQMANQENENEWNYTFENLPQYDANGNEIEYQLSEKETGDIFYTKENAIIDQENKTVTNKFVVPDEKITIDTTVIWEDNNNKAQKRPDSTILVLTGNGKEYKNEVTKEEVNPQDANQWNHTFTNLPKYDENGDIIEYTLSQENTSIFYTKENTTIDQPSKTVTNRFEVPDEKVSVDVTVIWDDDNNRPNKRPEKTTVTIEGDGLTKTQELTAKNQDGQDKNTWIYTFEDLPKYDENGDEIDYQIGQEDLNNKFYPNPEIDQEQNTIINKFIVPDEKITIDTTVIWEDNNNKAQKRPDSTILVLTGDGKEYKNEVTKEEVNPQDTNQWNHTFTNLPKYNADGNPIEYILSQENTSIFYTKENTTIHQDTKTVINRFEVPDEKISVKVAVIWEDDNNRANKRPDSTTLILTGNEKQYTKKVTLDKTNADNPNQWDDIFEDLPKYDENGNIINYILGQELNNKFYTKENTTINQDNKTVINKFVVPDEKVNVEITVKWEDNDNKLEKRPDKVVLTVTGNGDTKEQEITADNTKPDNKNEWIYTFEDLPKYDENGDEIEYIINEKDLESEFYTKTSVDQENNIITNTFDAETIKIPITVTKIWEGDENALNRRPEYVTLQIKNEEKIIAEEIVTEEQNWTHEFKVSKYDAYANEINYTIGEKELNNKFYPSENVTINQQDKTITNKFVVPDEKIELKVTVEWKDNEIQSQRRPESVIVVVKKGEEEVARKEVSKTSQEGTESDKWILTFKDLPKYDENGQEIQYTVDELEKQENDLHFYTKTIGNVIGTENQKEATITNTFTRPEDTTEITADIIWEDNEDEKGKRPDTVIIEVKNGDETEQSYELDTKTEDTHTFTDLPKYDENGQEIEYTINQKEKNEDDLEFYTTTIEGTTITNTFRVPDTKISVKVNKVWVDKDNAYQKRPETILITLKNKETEEVVGKEILRLKMQDSYTFTDLPKYDENANKIVYVADEEEINENDLFYYEKQVSEMKEIPNRKNEEQITITNTIVKIPAIIEINYIDRETQKPIIEPTQIEGIVGEEYEVEPKDIPYYKKVDNTNNIKGEIKDEKIEVIYYYEKMKFDLEINKWITNVTMDGISKGGKSMETKDELYQVDVHRRKVDKSNITVKYKIRVSNVGEIEGTADEITEIIPRGFSYYQEDNPIVWQDDNGRLTTTALANETIKPGEFKEIEIVLRWDKGEQNFGQKNNIVILTKTNNPAGYKDTNEGDNNAQSKMILTISTGLDSNDKLIMGLVQIVLVISIALLLGNSIKYKR